MEPCSTLAQFKSIDELYYKLARGDKANIEEQLGCLFPCTYTEYQVIINKKRTIQYGFSDGSSIEKLV